MFVRYGRAAMLAAIMTLTANAVWAQETWPQGGFANGYASSDCCQQAKCGEKTTSCAVSGGCCKAGKCCKASECCCKAGKCCKASECCCKDGKCECKTGGECCCEKGKCTCKDKACGDEVKCPCCPFLHKLAKKSAIIMVMPASMPLMGGCPMEAMGMMPHPPMPPGPNVMMPAPILSPPGIPPQPSAMPVIPPPMPCYGYACSGMVPHEVGGAPMYIHTSVKACPVAEACQQIIGMLDEMCCHGQVRVPPAPCCAPCEGSVAPCCTTGACLTVKRSEASPQKVHISATSSSDQLEMNIGEDTCIRCKKMAVKMGENEIALSHVEGRIRVRGEDLKASADSVRSDGKDRLILEGDVVLHYKKDGHVVNVTGDRIDVNLSSGTVTIKPSDKRPDSQTSYIQD